MQRLLETIALPTELHPDLSVKMVGLEPTTHGVIVIPTAFTTLGPPGWSRTTVLRLSGECTNRCTTGG